MRKLLIVSALLLFAGIAFGQTLKKGNILGVHHLTITLDPDVTMNQYLDLFENKYIPEFEKVFPDMKLILIRSIRGQNENKFGLIYYFESEKIRDQYFNGDDQDDQLNE